MGGWDQKVQLEKDYSTPRDLSDVPFLYDFTEQEYPPAILFFHVTPTQQVYIPQMEVGKILKGDQSGNTEIFAQGFLSPAAVDFDNYGAMLVTDSGNGIFKITHDEWTIPSVIEKIDEFIKEGFNGFKYIFKQKTLKLFALNFALISATTFFMFWFYQSLAGIIGIDVKYNGFIGAGFNLFSMLLLLNIKRIENSYYWSTRKYEDE